MNDFMNKSWGAKKLFIDESLTRVLSADIAALILCTNGENFEKFKSLQSFKEILTSLGEEIGIYTIQSLQIGIFNAISKLKISKFSVLMTLESLRNEGVISKSKYNEISKFLLSIKSEDENESGQIAPKNFAFYGKLDELDAISSELENLFLVASEDELSAPADLCERKESLQNPLYARLKTARENAKDANFTLSVTGVINAGKSSMLNCLLNLEILGTSNIPETANLTLLKGSDTPYAKVKFYDNEELEILGFADEFKAKFGARESEEIEPEKLKEFTSAKYEISKFIKFIELGIKSDFLSDKITVVDTPGLDDSVVLREELTKSFMFSSDAIIHLMNASQSSTKKDMSFIAQTLKGSKNNSLIVVLTHADLLSERDLLDALGYARASICDELEAFGFNDRLIENVAYFCIDSHSGRGISELKAHLYERFFGENSAKASEILSSYKKELSLICDTYLEDLVAQNANFSANKSELAKKSDEINNEILALDAGLSKLNNELDGAVAKLDYDSSSLFVPLKSAILTIKDRVLSDINYSKKNKKSIDFSRLEVIANSGIKDVTTDIFRSFSQKISRDIADIKEFLGSDFSEIDAFKFDTKTYMDENFKSPNFAKFNESLREVVKKNSDFSALSNALDTLFSKYFSELGLEENFASIAKTCTQKFRSGVLELFDAKSQSLHARATELTQTLKNSSENALANAQNARLAKAKLNALNALIKRIELC